MRHAPLAPGSLLATLLAFVALGALPTGASARPRPAPPRPAATFAQPTSYRSCQTVVMFACGKRDAAGHTYGTAHERQTCEGYTFFPDGTVQRDEDFGPGPTATYVVRGDRVIIREAVEDAQRGPTIEVTELVLSADRTKLGGMTRVPR